MFLLQRTVRYTTRDNKRTRHYFKLPVCQMRSAGAARLTLWVRMRVTWPT